MSKEIRKFTNAVSGVLREWVKEAISVITMDGSPLRDKYKSTAATVEYRLFLRSLNVTIDSLRGQFKALYEEYKDIEQEAERGDLPTAFLKHMQLDEKLKESVKKTKAAADIYWNAIEEVKKVQPNYRKYLSEKNEAAIKFLTDLSIEKLQKLILDASLTGF